MDTRRLTWMRLAAFFVFILIFLGISGGPARAEVDPTTISVRTPASDKMGNDLFAPSSRRGSRDWSNDPTVVRSRFVDVNASLLSGMDGMAAAALPGASILALNLFDDVAFSAALERLDPLASGGFTWVGRLETVDRSLVTFVVKDGMVTGNIGLPGGVMYQVRYAGNGVHAVREIDQSMFPPEAEPISVEMRPEIQDSGMRDPAVAGDDGSSIDVLVVYTPLARESAGQTSAAIEAEIDLAVSETNSSYENSGINQRLNLVHTAEVSYTETTNFSDALYRVTNPSDGYMDEVHSLRDTYCADEVVLIVGTGSYCGVAWVMNYVSSGFQSNAFAVVALSCATGYYSFGHELGHNMGAQHDWYESSATQPYPYSHGYVNTQDRWRTVMAYNAECYDSGFNCTRIPYWSNPNVTYGGDPMGVPEGEAEAADNRKTLNNTAATVANFRQSCSGAPPDAAVPISPIGTISETNPAYSWSSAPDSTVYYLSITGPTGNVIEANYSAAEVCSGDVCSVASPASLETGDNSWKIQTWNSFGFGPWSSETPFTVSLDGQGEPLNRVLLVLLNLLMEEN